MTGTLSAVGLECARGERTLFSGLNLRVPAGGLLEVRGANGSGKTTLLRALCGLFTPAAGHIRWNDTDVRELGDEYRSRLFYLGHANALKDELSAAENLRAAASLAGIAAQENHVDAALHELGLCEVRHLPSRMLSQGQRRRAALARLHLSMAQPLWILDEPFNALDAAATRTVVAHLETHLNRGGTVVLTTHQDLAINNTAMQKLELAS